MTEKKQHSLIEVAKHTKRDDCWMAIHGKVYDVTSFLLEHPGGDDILVETSGRDATREFEDVGHSTEARSHLDELLIGFLREPTEEEKAEHAMNVSAGKSLHISIEKDNGSVFQSIAKYLIPLFIISIGLIIRRYTTAAEA